MKRVVFIVEGDTELSFIQKCVIPYLYLKGFTNPMNAQKILTNRKRNKKGGNVGFDYLKNDVARVAAPSKRLMHIFPYEKTTELFLRPFSTCMVENDLWGMFRL